MAGQSWEGKPRASADASQEARKTTRSPQCPGSSDCRERDGERSMSAFSHSTRGLKSKSKVAAWLVSDDSSLLSYRWPLLTMSSHGIRREKGSERGWEREGENKLSGVSSCCLVAKSCPTLHSPIDYGLPHSPLSMGFLRQEYWSGLPLPSPGNFPNSEVELETPPLAGGFFTAEPTGKPQLLLPIPIIYFFT